jgi:hypothetical protein
MSNYLIKMYDDVQYENVVEASSVYVDGTVAIFSNISQVQEKDEENTVPDYEIVASIDISKMFFMLLKDEKK